MTDKLTIADIRKSARCTKGMRKFLSRHMTKAEYHDFLYNGYDLNKARRINDIDVRAAVKCADERIAEEAANGRSS